MTKDSGGGQKDEKKGRVDITLIEETCGLAFKRRNERGSRFVECYCGRTIHDS